MYSFLRHARQHHLRPAFWTAGALWLAFSPTILRAVEPQKAPTAGESRPTASAAEIREWISQLDDNRYLVRETATQKLLEAGVPALDPLAAAADAGRPEPADRSVWILRRLSNAKEAALRRQALGRLANLKKRPQIAAAAREALVDIEHQEALAAIEKFGGQYNAGEYMTQFGPAYSGQLVLDENWRGGDAGLALVKHLKDVQMVVVLGADVTTEGLKELKDSESLRQLMLYGTKLAPEDVPKLREALTERIKVDYRKGGLLGVSSASPGGVGPAVVGYVKPGSAAALAGIQLNDVIQKFDGEAIPNFEALTAKVSTHPPGDEVTLDLTRNGQPMQFKVKLGKWKTID